MTDRDASARGGLRTVLAGGSRAMRREWHPRIMTEFLEYFRGGLRVALRRLERRHFGAIDPTARYDPSTSVIVGRTNFYFGKNVYIGPGAQLSADGVPVIFGDDTIVGPAQAFF